MARLVTVLGLFSVAAQAWGPEGHALVARIAERYLTADAKAKLAAILEPGQTIVSVASWADEVRPSRPETGRWHYVNSPVSRPHFDLARDCPDGHCVVAKIGEMQKQLADPATTPRRRREALMFLIHFVGDMHQPLHSADNGDRGGNAVQVSFFGKKMPLHRLWDSGLLDRMGPQDDLLESLLAAISKRKASSWRKGTPETWADSIHRGARTVVYGRLPKAPKGAVLTLGAPYEAKARPLVREQLEKAGVRLASILNRI
jgi:hypothetical protein